MKILKFGGKSLTNDKGLPLALDIIQKQAEEGPIAVVVSARSSATDDLESILEKAKNGENYKQALSVFKREQLSPDLRLDVFREFARLKNTLEAVQTLGDYSPVIKDWVLAQGEILSAKMIANLLEKQGHKAISVSADQLLKTENINGIHEIQEAKSEQLTKEFFSTLSPDTIPIITGFIASNNAGQITTLGRNGSNFSASLFAKFLDAKEVRSYTNVNGIYTANPAYVRKAVSIPSLSYQEAHELANFGAAILHEKTIAPLVEKKIPLRILNTFDSSFNGTLVGPSTDKEGVKSISVQDKVSLIQIEGPGLLGKVGVDARIFQALQAQNISIGLVSQGSSERGVSFIVEEVDEEKAIQALEVNFKLEILHKDISTISSRKNIGVITVIGQNLNQFHPALKALSQNQIEVLLINNTSTGSNISLVVDQRNIDKAVHLIHQRIFGVAKKINVAIFGKGTVGGSLIDQIVASQSKLVDRKQLELNVFAVTNSKKIWFTEELDNNWKNEFEKGVSSTDVVADVIAYAKKHHLENLIAIDNTASEAFTNQYIPLIQAGFDLVSSNKQANTRSYSDYKNLRQELRLHDKEYLYETNVGAGLPLIDTIKLLHESGENITRIKGIFSGSLSFIFNRFSQNGHSFSEVLQEAIDSGYTEPDPREDLCGNDVARKLLILARELDLENEISDVDIQNLVPENLQSLDQGSFLKQIQDFDTAYLEKKKSLKENHVLRYVGDLYGDLQQSKGELKVELVEVPQNSPLGSVSGADSIIEIYTDSYGDRPIVIQGAGAGAEVTARGVFGDILRIADKK